MQKICLSCKKNSKRPMLIFTAAQENAMQITSVTSILKNGLMAKTKSITAKMRFELQTSMQTVRGIVHLTLKSV